MTDQELQTKLGNATEKFIVKTLKGFGYWSYNIPKKTNGQPCDIVTIKGKDNGQIITWLIDGKHVRDKDVSFDFCRVESNQITSMRYARDFAHIPVERLGFAIFFDRDKQLRWLPFQVFEAAIEAGSKSVNMHDLVLFTEVLKNADSDWQ